ncbi:hypothetical protein OKW21_005529 [Catalinimonas alkaloidigena]|uniref:hypothetical protein n=1 Tax=Catalinimonas alkaloidigena TaxID=1075417 RepID=UPI00240670AB|nr:hypothetical protein [Catalinimonas alkaloidigena]MDF9800266.1 hypothetical protein [Catalinimonas alkaloidigena]
MSTKEKIKQALDTLSEKDLEKVEQLVEALKSKKGRRTKYLKLRDFGGKFDHVNIRDIAYE